MNEHEKHIQAASGYLQLRMYQDANDELAALPPELKTSRQVLGIRACIYQETKAWQLLER
jgi:uncharacterized protein HemY